MLQSDYVQSPWWIFHQKTKHFGDPPFMETSTFGLSGNLWGNNILCWIDRLAFLKRWFWTLYLSSLGLDIYTIVLVDILGVNPSPPWDLSESSIRWGSFLVMPLISVETTLLLVQIWVISCTVLYLHISGPTKTCFELFECWNGQCFPSWLQGPEMSTTLFGDFGRQE